MAPAPDTACQLSETLTISHITKSDKLSDFFSMSPIVLVVEDDEILRSLTVEAISLLGVRVMDCASAEEALPMLEDSTSIALVITDVCMPGSMDGLELANVIWSRWPCLPVIVMSGDKVTPDSLWPPNSLFLRKPCSLDALYQAVRTYLSV
jgi:DNA-binding NtrC family response regulator